MKFIQVVPSRIYRGQQPESRVDFEQLQQLGVRTVLDLQDYPGDLTGAWRRYRTGMAFAHGMTTVPLPMGFVLPPRDATLNLAISLLSGFANQGPVYVHCKDGVDRTGMVCAAYRRKVLGETTDAVVKDMLASGFHRGRYFWWIPYLRRYCDRD